MILGYLNVEQYLKTVKGLVTGDVVTDAKSRQYRQTYNVSEAGDRLVVQRTDGNGDSVHIPKSIPLDEPLVAFFGLYSGDGAKGSEAPNDRTRIVPTISFSQKEKHLVRFAVDQFRRLFPGNIRFTFSLGEDSAFFMTGEGKVKLEEYYRKIGTPMVDASPLATVRPSLNDKDKQYLGEIRPDVQGSNETHLAFYYQHKLAMERIFIARLVAASNSRTASTTPPLCESLFGRSPGIR